MKNTLRRLLALSLAAMMLCSFAACTGKDEAATTVTEETTAAAEDVNATTLEAPSETLTDVITETATATTAQGETSTIPADGETTSAEPTTAAAAPSTTAEVLAYYTQATAKAKSAKPAFAKNRETYNEQFDAGLVLKTFKSLIYKFMGIGADNKYSKTVAKGEETKFIAKCALSQSDITSAECKTAGTDYVITIKVKGGSSHADKNSYTTTAPIEKSGICAGLDDKDYYDHKAAQNIYDAIGGTFEGAIVDEKYSNAVVTATIDSATGNLKKLVVTFDIEVSIDKVAGSSASATGTTKVEYKDFKW